MLSFRRCSRRWLAAGSAALVFVLLLATAVSAHNTTVAQSSPADGATVPSPSQVTAQFTEELDTKQSVMQVFDAAGQQVSEGNGKVDLNDPDHKTMIAAIPNPLPNGAYTVRWHVYLTDGDDSSGTFGFTVAAGASTPAATAAATATTAATATAAATATIAASPTVTETAAAAAVTATTTPAVPGALPQTGSGVPTWPAFAAAAAVVLLGALVVLRAKAR